MISREDISGIVLAGGRGQRMGETDKGWVMLSGSPLISHVIHALQPQVGTLIVSANRNLQRYRELGYAVVSDAHPDFAGPLAGISRALAAAQTPWALVAACDMPGLPANLASRLTAAAEQHQADVAVAHDGVSIQPVLMLLRTELQPTLEAALAQGQASVKSWLTGQRYTEVDFSDVAEALANINTPEQLAQLESRRD